MLDEWLTRLRFLMVSKSHNEIDEELQFHIEQQTQANIDAGLTPLESHRQAVVAFGGVGRAREQSHEQRPGYLVETLIGPVQAIMAGEQKFTAIPVPVLAIFAEPHAIGDMYKDNPSARAAMVAADTEKTETHRPKRLNPACLQLTFFLR